MLRALLVVSLVAVLSCNSREHPASASAPISRPSILLITLDTTRADAVGPEGKAATPAYNALAARGRSFGQAYATTPQTLPSHSSMMTGLYPAGHGVHENGRYLDASRPVLADRLRAAGYRTAAFVSAFALARRFGLARGFEVYDDDFDGGVERTAKTTTDRALAWLQQQSDKPAFIWVHYYDPHFPYTPQEPFLSRYPGDPYLGEVAAMDEQLGRLVAAYERKAIGPKAIIVAADHGEGLGEHGEAQHGNLLYQSTMHVPLVVVGPGFNPGVDPTPVSTRRIFHTVQEWAGLDAANSLRRNQAEVIVGEAMVPFLQFGWQPQVMAVEGRQKAILAGNAEVYDVIADSGELSDLSAQAVLTRGIRAALRDYPVPSLQPGASPPSVNQEEQRKLASLGYVSSMTKPVVRKDAPRPADMVRLFPVLDRAGTLFVRERYAEAIPLLEQILRQDPHNLDAALRLATAHSALGHYARAGEGFRRAEAIAPESRDVRTYLALHYARGDEWLRAVPMLERVVIEEPERVPALEALAVVRERQKRVAEAVQLREKIYAMRAPAPQELLRLAEMQMELGQTEKAITTFEKARAAQGAAFNHHLDLGVLYLASRRFEEARDALDRVRSTHPGYPMALFKRAQVSVLLGEPNRAARIAAARTHADRVTRGLIERE
ncbi:MAG: sulfatase-like hydrolase/transferase, partial [Thermoanaerobaculia bacterium]